MGDMAKPPASKIPGFRTNVCLVLVFLLVYILLLRLPFLRDEDRPLFVPSSLHDHHCCELERRVPFFHDDSLQDAKLGLVNLGKDEVKGWRTLEVKLQKASGLVQWNHLFPEWIDEEEVRETPSCPEIPMPDFSKYDEVDAVVARLPCHYPHAGWARDVFRLQVHLTAANFAAWRAKRDGDGRVKLFFLSRCQPMMEIFRVGDLVSKEDEWWFYQSDARRLQLKVSLPVGSCRLSLPPEYESRPQKEAYATLLHSSQAYVCGAIVLAHSIRRSGSSRDLVLLHDRTISDAKLRALATAGWKLRTIDRIRNPNAEKNTYNEYNYSKLRLWQLTDYEKVVFLDADALVLRNIDHLFRWPEMSAAGNDGFMFNSGVMVVEPSNATFSGLMSRRDEIVSCNGGDQGFLNEAFVWWHRLPRRVNYLKVFPPNAYLEPSAVNRLFVADPPELDVVHYLGQKPWLCYRDYDCNWNAQDGKIYASDEAHRVWWRIHHGIAPELKRFCGLPAWRKSILEEERSAAEAASNPDGHWKIKVANRRQF